MAKKKVTRRRQLPASKQASPAPSTNGPKKRTAKAKKPDVWDNLRDATSKALKATLATAREEFHDPTVCVGTEADRLVIGIPFPSLSLEYLAGTNVFPLGRITSIVGEEGSCKSGLAMEMARWHIERNGVGMLLENESKYSPMWANSIVGWRQTDYFGHIKCESVDDWQEKMHFLFDKQEDIMCEAGAIYPFVLILDSIMGKLTEESQTRIAERGHAGREFAVEAMSITRFMQSKISGRISDWPWSLIYINHLKPQKDAQTHSVQRNIAGGKGAKFQQSFELEVKKIGKVKTNAYDGLKLQLRPWKNSLGDDRRQAVVEVHCTWGPMYADDPDSDWRQHTKFLWDRSDISLLEGGQTGLPPQHAARVREIINIQPLTGGRVACKALGITRDSPLSRDEAGQALKENAQVMSDLRKALGIAVYREFESGQDYRLQRGAIKKEIVEHNKRVAKRPKKKKQKDAKDG